MDGLQLRNQTGSICFSLVWLPSIHSFGCRIFGCRILPNLTFIQLEWILSILIPHVPAYFLYNGLQQTVGSAVISKLLWSEYYPDCWCVFPWMASLKDAIGSTTYLFSCPQGDSPDSSVCEKVTIVSSDRSSLRHVMVRYILYKQFWAFMPT